MPNTTATIAAANNANKTLIFKNFAPFTDCISEINNTQVYNAKSIDVTMPIYNIIEHSDKYLKTSGSLWQYFKDEPAVNGNGAIVGFNEANPTKSLNFKAKITGQKTLMVEKNLK